MQIAYPFRFDAQGHTATTSEEQHLFELIEQVLFTAPGERVNQPDFGTGLRQLVFSPNSPELAAATQFLVQGALNKWLSDLIQVDEVAVAATDSHLTVTIGFTDRRTQQRSTADFTLAGAQP
jgi:hypothetical protein